jgi:hypothetical protein
LPVKQIGKVVERIGLGLDLLADDRPRDREDDRRLDDAALAAKYRDKPVRLSHEILAKLGLCDVK